MANLFPAIESFDELRSVARKIDHGLNHLENKFENVTNLGLSVDPRKTKKMGEDVLDELTDEIEEMKRDVNSVTKSHEEALQDRINDNDQIFAFIEQLASELQEIEDQLRTKPNYVPYEQPPASQGVRGGDNDVTDSKDITCPSTRSSFIEPQCPSRKAETPQNRKLNSSLLSASITNAMNSLNTSMDHFLSPAGTRNETLRRGKNPIRQDYAMSYELDNRSIISECGDSASNSLAILEKKLNRTDDNIVKTPEDPGVSTITMKLLGRSNLKTRVYKENIANISYLN